MKLKKPIKLSTSIRLKKEDKERIYQLTNNLSWFVEEAVLEKLDREEWKIKND